MDCLRLPSTNFTWSILEYLLDPYVFHKKAILKNFFKFTGKHLCLSLILIKLQAYYSLYLFWKRYPERVVTQVKFEKIS